MIQILFCFRLKWIQHICDKKLKVFYGVNIVLRMKRDPELQLHQTPPKESQSPPQVSKTLQIIQKQLQDIDWKVIGIFYFISNLKKEESMFLGLKIQICLEKSVQKVLILLFLQRVTLRTVSFQKPADNENYSSVEHFPPQPIEPASSSSSSIEDEIHHSFGPNEFSSLPHPDEWIPHSHEHIPNPYEQIPHPDDNRSLSERSSTTSENNPENNVLNVNQPDLASASSAEDIRSEYEVSEEETARKYLEPNSTASTLRAGQLEGSDFSTRVKY